MLADTVARIAVEHDSAGQVLAVGVQAVFEAQVFESVVLAVGERHSCDARLLTCSESHSNFLEPAFLYSISRQP